MNEEQHGGKSTRRQLDALVVGVELTLMSIIQGVTLSFLTESARASPEPTSASTSGHTLPMG
jgi:hypothetical protein